jgi:hypothetical protein
LPILFLIGPVCYAFISVFFKLAVAGSIGQLSILLLTLYTMVNSLLTLLFVAPYREHTLRIFGLKKEEAPIKRQLSLKTTQHPPAGQFMLNKIASIAEGPVIVPGKNEIS